MDLKKLTEEQKKKIAECKTPEDYVAAAKEFGYELTDEHLEKIGGGVNDEEIADSWGRKQTCPYCGSSDVEAIDQYGSRWHCNSCGRNFWAR